MVCGAVGRLVKESDITGLVVKYCENERWDCIEAFYHWALLRSEHEIRRILNQRHGSDGAYDTMLNDIKRIGIKYRLERTEDTRKDVGGVVTRAFNKHCKARYQEWTKSRH